MTLGEMIAQILACPHSRPLKIGLGKPHSYRGSYVNLAFELVVDTSVVAMHKSAEECIGRMFGGWKGGEFTMDKSSQVYVAWRGDCGVELTPEFLAMILAGEP